MTQKMSWQVIRLVSKDGKPAPVVVWRRMSRARRIK